MNCLKKKWELVTVYNSDRTILVEQFQTHEEAIKTMFDEFFKEFQKDCSNPEEEFAELLKEFENSSKLDTDKVVEKEGVYSLWYYGGYSNIDDDEKIDWNIHELEYEVV